MALARNLSSGQLDGKGLGIRVNPAGRPMHDSALADGRTILIVRRSPCYQMTVRYALWRWPHLSDYEWDEQKRAANLLKHQLDFVDARELFVGNWLENDDSRYNFGERR